MNAHVPPYMVAINEAMTSDTNSDVLVVVHEGNAWTAIYKGKQIYGFGYLEGGMTGVDYRDLLHAHPCAIVRWSIDRRWDKDRKIEGRVTEDRDYAAELARVNAKKWN